MKVFLGMLLGLAVVAGFAWFLLGENRSAAPAGTAEPSVSTMSVKETTDTYEIDVDYPQFGIASIDVQIRNEVDDALADFKTISPNPADSASGLNGFHGQFSSAYIGPDIVSAQLLLSEYTGGAHDLPIIIGLNFDRATGRRLELEDALAMTGKSVAKISEQASAELRAKFGEDFFVEGANTNPENFSTFVVSKDAVTFIFQPYQVAAYAAGVQEARFARIK